MSYKYNPYRDVFEHIEDEQPITACGTGCMTGAIPVYSYPVVYIADDCITKIADAVAKRLMEADL